MSCYIDRDYLIAELHAGAGGSERSNFNLYLDTFVDDASVILVEKRGMIGENCLEQKILISIPRFDILYKGLG